MNGRKSQALSLFLPLLLLASCATLEKQQVSVVPQQTPQVSPVLQKEAPQRTLKRKVAIARFSNETKYGSGFFSDSGQNQIGKQATDILSTRLTETGKFLLLERADYDKIEQELKSGGNEALKIPADYLVVGSISEFGRKNTSDVGIFSRVKKQSAYAKVNVRLVAGRAGAAGGEATGEAVEGEPAEAEA